MAFFSFNMLAMTEKWQPAEMPKNEQEISALKERSNQEIAQAEKYAKEYAEDKDTINETKENLVIARAQYNLKTADIAEIDVKPIDEATPLLTRKQELEQEQEKLIKSMNELTNKLSGLLTGFDMANRESLNDITKDIANVIKRGNIIDLQKMQSSFNSIMRRWFDDVKKEPDVTKKLTLLNQKRSDFNDIYSAIVKELEAPKNQQISYKKELEHFKNILDKKRIALDEETISASVEKEKKQRGFFARLARAFKVWYDHLFGEKPPSPATISSQISELAPSQDVINVFISINNFTEQLKRYNTQRDDAIKRGDRKESENIKNNIQQLVDNINKNYPAVGQVNQLNEGYNRIVLLKLSLEEYRLRSQNEPTLFDTIANHYAQLVGQDAAPSLYAVIDVSERASIDTIKDKIKGRIGEIVAKKELNDNDTLFLKASSIVSNPLLRETYDAFLKDYRFLERNNIPVFGKKTESTESYLKTKGALSNLAINKDEYDKNFAPKEVQSILNNVQAQAGEEYISPIDAANIELKKASEK